MRLRASPVVLVYVLGASVLTMALLVAVRVTLTARYSLSGTTPDARAENLLAIWSEIEADYAVREAPSAVELHRDPMWPVYVPRPAPASLAAPAARPPRQRPEAIAAPERAPVLPEIVALLLDGEPRALLRLDGRSRLARPGDRLGGVRVVDVGSEGVTVEWPGGRRLLRLARPRHRDPVP